MPIRVLPPKVASLIAAGEVIERPASVVRELIENAIDGGARKVEVSIPFTNFSRIIVEDDGVGMSEQDLGLACLHHATSKLNDDSVQLISTLGFRGEALASIAAVAHVFITSRPAGSIAFRVSAQQDKISEPMPTSGGFGTRVVVENLFMSHPARLAFLKSFSRELALVEEAVEKCALAWPAVKFVFHKAHKTITLSPRLDVKERIRDIRGGFLKTDGIPVFHMKDDVSVEGLACLPTVLEESKKGNVDIIVNGRLVSDRALSGVVHSVYRAMTGKEHRPYVSLSIAVPPLSVNLNVHPTKSEVRFRDPQKISEIVREAVQNALDTSGLKSRSSLKGLAKSLSNPVVSVDDKRRRPLGRFLGQANNSWLLAETLDGIVIVDQHAAHERVILERLKKAAAQIAGETYWREIPFKIAVSGEQAAAVEEMLPALEDAAFVVGVKGKEVILEAYPAVLSDCSPQDIINLIVEHSEFGTVSGLVGDALWEHLATAACKAAVKAGHQLSAERADALLREIEDTPNASYCNHGRPTIKFLSMADIGKLFER